MLICHSDRSFLFDCVDIHGIVCSLPNWVVCQEILYPILVFQSPVTLFGASVMSCHFLQFRRTAIFWFPLGATFRDSFLLNTIRRSVIQCYLQLPGCRVATRLTPFVPFPAWPMRLYNPLSYTQQSAFARWPIVVPTGTSPSSPYRGSSYAHIKLRLCSTISLLCTSINMFHLGTLAHSHLMYNIGQSSPCTNNFLLQCSFGSYHALAHDNAKLYRAIVVGKVGWMMVLKQGVSIKSYKECVLWTRPLGPKTSLFFLRCLPLFSFALLLIFFFRIHYTPRRIHFFLWFVLHNDCGVLWAYGPMGFSCESQNWNNSRPIVNVSSWNGERGQ